MSQVTTSQAEDAAVESLSRLLGATEVQPFEVALSHSDYIEILAAISARADKLRDFLPEAAATCDRIEAAIRETASHSWVRSPLGRPYPVTLLIEPWRK